MPKVIESHNHDAQPNPVLPPQVLETVERFREYGWKWSRIAPLVCRLHGVSFTGAELECLYKERK